MNNAESHFLIAVRVIDKQIVICLHGKGAADTAVSVRSVRVRKRRRGYAALHAGGLSSTRREPKDYGHRVEFRVPLRRDLYAAVRDLNGGAVYTIIASVVRHEFVH
jgi:hypothetical protein